MIDSKPAKILSFGIIVAVAAMLAACSSEAPPIVAPMPAPMHYLDLSPVGPPPPKFEMKPVVDLRTQIWRPGYWAPENGSFVWVPGKIMAKPSFTAVWSPDRWERHKYGWGFIHGFWQ